MVLRDASASKKVPSQCQFNLCIKYFLTTFCNNFLSTCDIWNSRSHLVVPRVCRVFRTSYCIDLEQILQNRVPCSKNLMSSINVLCFVTTYLNSETSLTMVKHRVLKHCLQHWFLQTNTSPRGNAIWWSLCLHVSNNIIGFISFHFSTWFPLQLSLTFFSRSSPFLTDFTSAPLSNGNVFLY